MVYNLLLSQVESHHFVNPSELIPNKSPVELYMLIPVLFSLSFALLTDSTAVVDVGKHSVGTNSNDGSTKETAAGREIEEAKFRLGELDARKYKHVVVIPDVHGDSDALYAVLHGVLETLEEDKTRVPSLEEFQDYFQKMIDKPENLLTADTMASSPGSGQVAVVQLGDLVDKGPHSILCMDIMLNVEAVIGWKTIVLYGNHELFRYYLEPLSVHKLEEAMYGLDALADAVRRKLSHVGLLMARLSLQSDLPIEDPRNPNTLFVHGSVDLDWLIHTIGSDLTMDRVNTIFRKSVQDPEKWRAWGPRSPLFSRDYTKLDEEVLCGDRLTKVLVHFNVARIVVGHMPQENFRVLPRCNNRVYLADVMMSRWMGSSGANPIIRPRAVLMAMDSSDRHLKSITEQAWQTEPHSIPHGWSHVLFDVENEPPEPSAGVSPRRRI